MDSLIIIQISYQITNNYDSNFVNNQHGTQNNFLILMTRKFPKKTLHVPEWDIFYKNKNKKSTIPVKYLIINYKLLNMGKFLTF
jgi:hypothetical protein